MGGPETVSQAGRRAKAWRQERVGLGGFKSICLAHGAGASRSEMQSWTIYTIARTRIQVCTVCAGLGPCRSITDSIIIHVVCATAEAWMIREQWTSREPYVRLSQRPLTLCNRGA